MQLNLLLYKPHKKNASYAGYPDHECKLFPLKISLMSLACHRMNIGMYHFNFELFLPLHPNLRNPPQPHLWLSRFLPLHHFLSGPFEKTFPTSLSFCGSISKQIPTSYVPRTLMHSKMRDRNKDGLSHTKTSQRVCRSLLDSLTCERAANLPGQANARHLLKVPNRLTAGRNILDFEL